MSRPVPLIFLHGWGLHGGIWAETIASLKLDEHPILTPDLPGYGDECSEEPYNADSLADTLSTRLPTPAILCGWSMGGMIAQAWAARYPEQIKGLILVGSTPAFANRDGWADGMPAEVLASFAEALALDYKTTLLRFLSLQARGGDAAREVIARLRTQVFSRGEPDPATLAAGLELLRTADLRDNADHIQCPTLILHGARDTLCPPAAAEWLASHIPDAHLALHPHAAHAPFLSHPDWFKDQIETFVDVIKP